MLGGHDNSSQRLSVSLDDIEATNYDLESQLSSRLPSQLTSSRIILKTKGAYYEIPVASHYEEDDFVALCGYLREAFGARPRSVSLDPDAAGYTIGGADRYEVDRATLTTLLDEVPPTAQQEADELLRTVDDADTLVQQLHDLIQEHESEEHEQSLDELVEEASSIEELRDELRTPAEKRLAEFKATTDAGVEAAKTTFAEGDPKVAAKWALNTGKMTKPLARSGAPGIATVSLAMAAAAITGLYADTHDASPLGDIDITELTDNAEAMAEVGEDLDNIDGEVIGALLGAASYLGEQFARDEYAQWVVNADPEAILRGAEHGTVFAQSDGSPATRSIGATYGGGVGLMAGYVAQSSDGDDQISRLLDEDLYDTYQQKT